MLTMTSGNFDCMNCSFEVMLSLPLSLPTLPQLIVGGNFGNAGGQRDTKFLASWDGEVRIAFKTLP